jgi:hypothetical protein
MMRRQKGGARYHGHRLRSRPVPRRGTGTRRPWPPLRPSLLTARSARLRGLGLPPIPPPASRAARSSSPAARRCRRYFRRAEWPRPLPLCHAKSSGCRRGRGESERGRRSPEGPAFERQGPRCSAPCRARCGRVTWKPRRCGGLRARGAMGTGGGAACHAAWLGGRRNKNAGCRVILCVS